jgi:hypothetical protein
MRLAILIAFADVEGNLATLRREMAAPGIPAQMLRWLLDFIAIAETKLNDLRDRRAGERQFDHAWQ